MTKGTRAGGVGSVRRQAARAPSKGGALSPAQQAKCSAPSAKHLGPPAAGTGPGVLEGPVETERGLLFFYSLLP